MDGQSNLIFVPDSNEQKAKKALTERVALALNITTDGWEKFVQERYPERQVATSLPEAGLFTQVFAAVFQQLC